MTFYNLEDKGVRCPNCEIMKDMCSFILVKKEHAKACIVHCKKNPSKKMIEALMGIDSSLLKYIEKKDLTYSICFEAFFSNIHLGNSDYDTFISLDLIPKKFHFKLLNAYYNHQKDNSAPIYDDDSTWIKRKD